MNPRTIQLTSIYIVAFIALASGILSYDALRILAQANGISPTLSVLWPLIIDGAIFMASLAVLRNSLLGERTIYPWALVITFSLASTFFNIAHAQSDPLSRAIAAAPPLVLLLSFELLMSQLRTDSRRQSAIETYADLTEKTRKAESQLTGLGTKIGTAEAKLTALRTEIKTEKAAQKADSPTFAPDTIDRAREIYNRFKAQGKTRFGSALGRELNISERSGRQLVSQFDNENGQANGRLEASP